MQSSEENKDREGGGEHGRNPRETPLEDEDASPEQEGMGKEPVDHDPGPEGRAAKRQRGVKENGGDRQERGQPAPWREILVR